MKQVYQNNTHRLFVSTEELMKVFLASENDIKKIDDANSLSIFLSAIRVINKMNEDNPTAKIISLDANSTLSKFLFECADKGAFGFNNDFKNNISINKDDVYVYKRIKKR